MISMKYPEKKAATRIHENNLFLINYIVNQFQVNYLSLATSWYATPMWWRQEILVPEYLDV